MPKKILYLTALLIIAAPILIWAEDKTVPENITYQPHNGVVMPPASDKFQEAAQNEIDKKNEPTPDTTGNDIKTIDYNEDGTIRTISFSDGTTSNYLYKHDENGELNECGIDSEKTHMAFTKDEKKGTVSVAITQKQAKPEKRKTAPQVIIYYPKDTVKLEEVARKPMKFDAREINEAIARASEMKDKAFKIYLNKASRYYGKVGKELKRNIKDLGAGNAKIKTAIEKIYEDKMLDPENRKTIDEAVRCVHSEARKVRPGEAVVKFISFENDLRGRILAPEKEAYNRKIEAAVKYIYGMIDKLVNSKLALYLNMDKDKIDVVISLPELKKGK